MPVPAKKIIVFILIIQTHNQKAVGYFTHAPFEKTGLFLL